MVATTGALIRYSLPLGIIVGVGTSSVALQRFSSEWQMIDLPLHAALEALGGFSAMALVCIRRSPRRARTKSIARRDI